MPKNYQSGLFTACSLSYKQNISIPLSSSSVPAITENGDKPADLWLSRKLPAGRISGQFRVLFLSIVTFLSNAIKLIQHPLWYYSIQSGQNYHVKHTNPYFYQTTL